MAAGLFNPALEFSTSLAGAILSGLPWKIHKGTRARFSPQAVMGDNGLSAQPFALRMNQRRRRRFDTSLVCRSQGKVDRDLNLAGRLFTGIAHGGDGRPFNDLGDVTFVSRFRRIPDTDFVISRREHFLAFLQNYADLAGLINLNLSMEILQIHEVCASLKHDVTSAALPRSKSKFKK